MTFCCCLVRIQTAASWIHCSIKMSKQDLLLDWWLCMMYAHFDFFFIFTLPLPPPQRVFSMKWTKFTISDFTDNSCVAFLQHTLVWDSCIYRKRLNFKDGSTKNLVCSHERTSNLGQVNYYEMRKKHRRGII